ncbi:MAG TPA: hypothetical protein VHJ17_07500 [Thermomonospora sp.]|nr:hypothetical protein [Thermomonospora sp.]
MGARRWLWGGLSAGVLVALTVAGALAGAPDTAPDTAVTPASGAAPAAPATGGPVTRHAGRARVFGLVQPGERPGEVLFAPARRHRRGGPETLRAVDVRPEEPLPLAPGADVRLTVPLLHPEPADPRRGAPVEPERLAGLFRAAQERLGTLHDRARMADLWFDGRGRVVRMHHHFSP